ncbi:MAG: NAD(P)-binding protein [Campylobacterota bacterium]|nr:NAD(P)-binding protein [Campylobacterota bacterium]
MRSVDMAVVGSGIGGSLISALNKDKDLILFEKDKNLGGCASTFKRYGNYYNTAATTLVGYEDGHILKKQFDKIGVTPDVERSDIAIRVVQDNKTIDRVKNFEQFLDQIEINYPNKNNREFWSKIKSIDEKFWKLQKIYYGKYSLEKYMKTGSFIFELFTLYGFDILKSADGFIKSILGDISQEYQKFIDAQLLITVQTTSKDISLLSLALGLSYPFHDVFYVNGGMGNLLEDIVKDVEVKREEEIKKVIKENSHWIIESNKEIYKTKQLILNSSIYQSSSLFEDEDIKSYFDSFSFSDQSAFVIYMTIDSKENFLDHYQFIYDELLPNCISNSFFVSFSKKADNKLFKNGYSITISTHTKADIWKKTSQIHYIQEKEKTMKYIVDKFLNYFTLVKKEDIKYCFSATSFTFNRYINRYNCGGKAIGFKNITELPSCNTPFKGLYNVGDTVFAGQGWPGVALGVDVLQRQLDESI